MAFDMGMAPAVVRLAWDRLLARGRVSPAPLRFCLEGISQDGQKFGFHLETDYPYRTPWGWPVLDMDSSVGTLAAGLTSVRENGQLSSLSLVIQQGGQEDEVIFDFLNGTLEPIPELGQEKLDVENLEDVLNSIMQHELKPNQCVAVVRQDMTVSFSDDLSAHMVYAMDGTKDILWIGANAGNGHDPAALKDAAIRACSIRRTGDIVVVAGEVVDLGDGWVLVRHPHLISYLVVETPA